MWQGRTSNVARRELWCLFTTANVRYTCGTRVEGVVEASCALESGVAGCGTGMVRVRKWGRTTAAAVNRLRGCAVLRGHDCVRQRVLHMKEVLLAN